MSAITPLQIAIDTAIQNDAVLSAKLRGAKVYSLTAPSSDDDLPYILLGQSTETALRMFGPKGYNGVEAIDAWSADLTKFEAADLAADLERILDMAPLSVDRHYLCTGSFSILAITIDPSGKYAHASCRYETLTFTRDPMAPTHVYRYAQMASGDATAPTGAGNIGYRFQDNVGLVLTNALASPGVYTIALDFSLDALMPTLGAGYAKLIDFKNRGTDGGFYLFGDVSTRYFLIANSAGELNISAQAPLLAGNRIVLTRDGAGLVALYVGGVLEFTYDDSVTQLFTFTGPGNVITLFTDDTVSSGQEYIAGVCSRVTLYDRVVSALEVPLIP